jgi:hypothetical protein
MKTTNSTFFFTQIAIQGEHVTLPCRVKNKKGMLQWTRDGFGLGVDRNLTGFHRYNMRGMMGSDEEGKEVFQYSQSPLYVVTFLLMKKNLFSFALKWALLFAVVYVVSPNIYNIYYFCKLICYFFHCLCFLTPNGLKLVTEMIYFRTPFDHF